MSNLVKTVIIGAILALAIGGAYLFPRYSNSPDIAGVTAVGGICDGSEPTTQLCNVNTYEIESQSGITGADLTLSDDASIAGTLTLAGLSNGGLYSTSSLAASTTLLASTVCDYGIISVVPGNVAGQIGVALPATTTLVADCFNSVGDSRTFLFENAATAATSTVITAPAGITLISDDANGDIIAQNGWAEVTITRIRATGDEFSAVIRPFLDAD